MSVSRVAPMERHQMRIGAFRRTPGSKIRHFVPECSRWAEVGHERGLAARLHVFL
jgi:hypothetical protein